MSTRSWPDLLRSVRPVWEFFAPAAMGKEESETVKAKRHTPNQVIRKLREAERMFGEGKTTAEVAKALEVSEVSFHRWRNPSPTRRSRGETSEPGPEAQGGAHALRAA